MKAMILTCMALVACGRVGFEHSGSADPDDEPALANDAGFAMAPGDATTGEATPQPNLVFVTSGVVTPSALGGLAGADATCAAAASAAGLGGTYRAWLSTSTVDAKDRLASARGWVRVDGRPVVDTVADLVSGKMYYPIRISETGQDIDALGLDYVITATRETGVYDPNGSACGDWTSATGSAVGGRARGATRNFTYGFSSTCTGSYRLYCFGVDRSVAVSAPALGARRRAFLAPSWIPGGGLASADVQCQGEADSAGLGGAWAALLATTTATAASRFDLTGPTWTRLDGVAVAETPSAFAIGQLQAPINLTADRRYVETIVWTGSPSPNLKGSATCVGWTSNQASDVGDHGYSSSSAGDAAFIFGAPQGCNVGFGLYCLER